ADQGLDGRRANATTGVEAQNELLSGAAQAVVGFYDHTIALQVRGNYVVSLVQFARAPGEMEIVSGQYADRIGSAADLKGLRLGVAGLGSSTDFLTRSIATRNGLRNGDYTLVPIEAGDSFIDAMAQGRIAAGMTTEPTAGQILKTTGAKILIDLRPPEATAAAFGGCYPGATLYVQSSWLATRPEAAQRLVTAFVKTMRFIASHDAAEIASHLPEDYFDGDRALYVERLRQGMGMFTTDGRMPAGCPEMTLEVLRSFSPKLKNRPVDLSQTYTTSLVDAALATLDAPSHTVP
ncbi:MAG: ABC transporter substrate-binding protein, partial [Methanobacterium sp.]|nr:ABC transporter substrate-binding protein [Methanobacterium sp.]